MGYAWALGLTLVVEVPVYTVALAAAGALGPRPAAVTGALVNLVTHPLLWLSVHVAGSAYWPVLALGEALVVLAEAALVRTACRRRGRAGGAAGIAVAAALTANAASVLAGMAAF